MSAAPSNVASRTPVLQRCLRDLALRPGRACRRGAAPVADAVAEAGADRRPACSGHARSLPPPATSVPRPRPTRWARSCAAGTWRSRNSTERWTGCSCAGSASSGLWQRSPSPTARSCSATATAVRWPPRSSPATPPPRHRGRPGQEAAHALLAVTRCPGRGPGHADPRAHPGGSRAGRAAVDHRAAGAESPPLTASPSTASGAFSTSPP